MATQWFPHEDVNALAKATADTLLEPIREYDTTAPELQGSILGYIHAGSLQLRPGCPQPPTGFAWGVGFAESRPRPPPDATTDGLLRGTDTPVELPTNDDPSAPPLPGADAKSPTCSSSTAHKRLAAQYESVASLAENNLIDVRRMKRIRMRKKTAAQSF